MAYGKSGGCTPITSKIQKTTKGGIVQPILKVGKVSPAKMKGDLNKDGKMSGYEQTRQNAIDKAMSSPAKLTPAERRAQSNKVRTEAKKAKEAAEAKAEANRAPKRSVRGQVRQKELKSQGRTSATAPKTKTNYTKSSGDSMTPTSVKNGKGVIYGPKVSYDMAYKNRNMKTYGKMSKSEYIAEAKRQTKSFKSTGKWDAPKPRKKQTTVSAVTPKKTVSVTTTSTPKAEVKVTKVTPKKETTRREANVARRKQASIDKKLSKAAEARAAGNIKKAERKEKRAARKSARVAKRAKK